MSSKKDIELTPSLRASIRDAVWFSIMLGAGESYFGAFGVYLGGSAYQIGILATLPMFLGSLSQLVGVMLMARYGSRRKLIVHAVRLQSLIWIPLSLIAFFVAEEARVDLLIVLVGFYYVLGNLAAPVWNSLIGDLVPIDRRGEFFGLRNRKSGYFVVLALAIAGVLLEAFERLEQAPFAFLIIFLFSGYARYRSSLWLAKHEDPPFEQRAEDHFSLFKFLTNSVRSNFARFVFSYAAINFAVFLAGPYFLMYMLQDLKMGLGQVMLVIAAQLVVQFGVMQNWGVICDQVGNKRVLTVCGLGIAVIPFLWLLSTNFYFILVVQAYSGLVWAGVNLAAFNFLFDAVTPPKRARCTAYMNVINGVSILLGALFGAWLIGIIASGNFQVSTLDGIASNYLVIFVISGVVRLIAFVFLAYSFRDVREVESLSTKDMLFRAANVRAFSGMRFEVFSGWSRKKDKSRDKLLYKEREDFDERE